jgi:CheY-like chemotaxis protein
MGFKINERNQEFSVTIDERIPDRLVGDDQRIAQVITNLLSNACKFTPEEGAISLSFVLVNEEDGFCTIRGELSDTGIGITSEQQSRLFDSFEQADSSTSRRFGGTGLGLTISRNIVEKMSGFIRVESKLGEGATFTFEMKVQRDKVSEITGVFAAITDKTSLDEGLFSKQNKLDFADKYILVAEDIDVNYEIIEALLEPFGITLDWALDGEEAVQMFAEAPERYDLIFMDMQMPDKNGLDATREIRSSGLPGCKTVPIIAMTANVFQEDVNACYAAGMNGHLGKPLDFTQVIKTLKKHLTS